MNDGKQVAADAARERLDESCHCIRGNGGVNGAAAVLQDASSDRRCQGVRGGDDSITGCNQRARAVECKTISATDHRQYISIQANVDDMFAF